MSQTIERLGASAHARSAMVKNENDVPVVIFDFDVST
jgi:hypothetical protein